MCFVLFRYSFQLPFNLLFEHWESLTNSCHLGRITVWFWNLLGNVSGNLILCKVAPLLGCVLCLLLLSHVPFMDLLVIYSVECPVSTPNLAFLKENVIFLLNLSLYFLSQRVVSCIFTSQKLWSTLDLLGVFMFFILCY